MLMGFYFYFYFYFKIEEIVFGKMETREKLKNKPTQCFLMDKIVLLKLLNV